MMEMIRPLAKRANNIMSEPIFPSGKHIREDGFLNHSMIESCLSHLRPKPALDPILNPAGENDRPPACSTIRGQIVVVA